MNPFSAFVSKYVPLSPAEVQLCESVTSFRRFRRRNIILSPGDSCRSILFITTGAARSLFTNSDGQEFTWNFHFNDTDSKFENYFILDYNSFLSQSPTPLLFESLQDTEAIELRYEDANCLFNTYPTFEQAGRVMAENAYKNIHLRAFSILTLSAKERYLQLLRDEPYLLNKFPLYYIASYLGMAPQSLSRLRKELAGK
jgi:CRP-like cAMP-binding protein